MSFLEERGINLFSQIATNVAIITTVFYASGFLSFIAHYRLLSIHQIKGDLQTYAEFAGKNIILIFQVWILAGVVCL